MYEEQEGSRLKVRLCLGIKQTLHLLQRAQNVGLGSAARCYHPTPSLSLTLSNTHTYTHTLTRTPLFYLSTGTDAQIPTSRFLLSPISGRSEVRVGTPSEVVTTGFGALLSDMSAGGSGVDVKAGMVSSV